MNKKFFRKWKKLWRVSCLTMIVLCTWLVYAQKTTENVTQSVYKQETIENSTQPIYALETTESKAANTSGKTKPYKIAVASDLHIDPENRYAGMVNPLVMFNMQLIDALLWDVQKQDVDFLLLCGDITNSGREIQHQALLEKLNTAKENGLSIYVLPGNHDIQNMETEAFADLYAEFGYKDAYSRDDDSLSYSFLFENYLILMIDTDGYSNRTNGAYVSEKTMQWVRSQLELSKENNWQVLTVGHYSLLTGQTTEFTGQEAMIRLLEEYQVSLYLCGHLHQRNVSFQNSLTELVIEQLASYPCSYAFLYKEEEDEYRYEPHMVDVSTWASETGETQRELLEFEAYGEEVLETKSKEIIITLKKDRWLSKKKQNQASDFFLLMQESYAEGSLYPHQKEILDHPGYRVFMDLAKGTTYEKWIPIIIESAVPYTTGFILKDHRISLLP